MYVGSHIALRGWVRMGKRREMILFEFIQLSPCSPIPHALPPRWGCRFFILLQFQRGLLEPREHKLGGESTVLPVSQTRLEKKTVYS